MSDTPAQISNEPPMVEVARARDRLEALVWARNLEAQGIEVRTEAAPVWPALLRWVRWLLYLGRMPQSVYVRPEDSEPALAYLKRFRFI